ncbi:MAG: efflux RND transporter periplasmic adaptor subunit [Moraxellaceae bacterium]
MRRTFSSIVLPAVAALLTVVLSGCGSSSTAKATAEPLPVQTFTQQAVATALTERYPATILRDREANLSFRIPGTVDQLQVRIGQTVHKDQLLASLAATPYAAALTRAEADKARLERLVRRNTQLLPAGAVSQSSSEDSASALAAAQAAVDAARYDVGSTQLRAPFTGIVLARDVEAGESVGPGQRVLRIADVSSLALARASVPAAVARELRKGSPATLLVGPEGREVKAQVLRIGALSDSRTATLEVDLKLAGAENLPSGIVGSVRFEDRRNAPASMRQYLPPEALLSAADGWANVFVLDPTHSVARRTRVRFLGFDGEWLQVEGLAPNAKVITAGAGFVSDGQSVREVTP